MDFILLLLTVKAKKGLGHLPMSNHRASSNFQQNGLFTAQICHFLYDSLTVFVDE